MRGVAGALGECAKDALFETGGGLDLPQGGEGLLDDLFRRVPWT